MSDSTGRWAGGRASMLIPPIAGHVPQLDLEVLYVGQSYGTDGSRSARDRLRSHSTLQAIYGEASRQSPDREIHLVLLGLSQPYAMIQIGPRTPTPPVEPTREELASDFTRLTTGIQEQQRINLAEASLIKYFAPPYNEMYKNRFPSPAHRTYAECYDLDLNTVGFELETTPLCAKLFSQERDPEWIHAHTFPFTIPSSDVACSISVRTEK